MQVQQRQHLGDLRGLARPRRQDRRGEPHPLTGGLIDPPVVDPRRPHRQRARRGRDLPLGVISVAHDQPTTGLVELIDVRVDVGGDLSLQGRSEHRARPVAHDLIQHRRARHRGVNAVLAVLLDYLEHGRTFPNQRYNAGPDQNCMGFGSSSGRCAHPRHPAEAHPQVLIIAPLPCMNSSLPEPVCRLTA
jgi:hypothetical protein